MSRVSKSETYETEEQISGAQGVISLIVASIPIGLALLAPKFPLVIALLLGLTLFCLTFRYSDRFVRELFRMERILAEEDSKDRLFVPDILLGLLVCGVAIHDMYIYIRELVMRADAVRYVTQNIEPGLRKNALAQWFGTLAMPITTTNIVIMVVLLIGLFVLGIGLFRSKRSSHFIFMLLTAVVSIAAILNDEFGFGFLYAFLAAYSLLRLLTPYIKKRLGEFVTETIKESHLDN